MSHYKILKAGVVLNGGILGFSPSRYQTVGSHGMETVEMKPSHTLGTRPTGLLHQGFNLFLLIFLDRGKVIGLLLLFKLTLGARSGD